MKLRLLAFIFLFVVVFAGLAFRPDMEFVIGGRLVSDDGWPSAWLRVVRSATFSHAAGGAGHASHLESISVSDWGPCLVAASVALVISALTVVAWPNHALQRTEAGGGVFSVFRR